LWDCESYQSCVWIYWASSENWHIGSSWSSQGGERARRLVSHSHVAKARCEYRPVTVSIRRDHTRSDGLQTPGKSDPQRKDNGITRCGCSCTQREKCIFMNNFVIASISSSWFLNNTTTPPHPITTCATHAAHHHSKTPSSSPPPLCIESDIRRTHLMTFIHTGKPKHRVMFQFKCTPSMSTYERFVKSVSSSE
jgi:hypothetical protein